jgi:hypothetical protein
VSNEKISMRTRITIGLIFLFAQFSCSDEQPSFDLKGTWIDRESSELQFIEFYSKNQGRFGVLAKDYEQYEDFNYRLFDNKIAIDFGGDNEGETVQNLTIVDKDEIQISGLPVPDHAAKTYTRYNKKSESGNKEIILGLNDVYVDFENGLKLQGHLINESRCPGGAQCIWAGYAAARFNLIDDGNEYTFDLSTIDLAPTLKRDTLINGITYKLLDITPYPYLNVEYKPEDYKVKVSIEK